MGIVGQVQQYEFYSLKISDWRNSESEGVLDQSDFHGKNQEI